MLKLKTNINECSLLFGSILTPHLLTHLVTHSVTHLLIHSFICSSSLQTQSCPFVNKFHSHATQRVCVCVSCIHVLCCVYEYIISSIVEYMRGRERELTSGLVLLYYSLLLTLNRMSYMECICKLHYLLSLSHMYVHKLSKFMYSPSLFLSPLSLFSVSN